MIDSRILSFLCSEGINTAAYLTNRSPPRANQGQTPEVKITGKKPNLTHLKSFWLQTLYACSQTRMQQIGVEDCWRHLCGIWRSNKRLQVLLQGYQEGYSQWWCLIWWDSNNKTTRRLNIVSLPPTIEAHQPLPLGIPSTNNTKEPETVTQEDLKIQERTAHITPISKQAWCQFSSNFVTIV